MAHAILGYGNLIDGAVLSGGVQVPSLPLTNAQERTLGRVVRTVDTDPGSTWFDIDLLNDELVRVIALINHNASLSATYRIRGSRSADFSLATYDSGWRDIWPAVYATAQLEWEATNFWDGRYLDRERHGLVWKLVHILPQARYLRHWRIEIRDISGGNPYFQFGRPFIAAGWQPVVNITGDGFGIGNITATGVQETLSGGKVFDRKSPRRVARFRTPGMDHAEAFGNAFEIQQQMGIDGEVLFITNPDDTVHAMRRQVYGTLRELNEIENPYAVVDGYGTAWAVEGV